MASSPLASSVATSAPFMMRSSMGNSTSLLMLPEAARRVGLAVLDGFY